MQQLNEIIGGDICVVALPAWLRNACTMALSVIPRLVILASAVCCVIQTTAVSASAGTLAVSASPTDGLTLTGTEGDRLTLDSKGITLRTRDDAVELHIGGRLHEDLGTAGVRPASLGPAFESAADLRRAWLETTLTLQKDVVAGFQYDFSKTDQPVNDAAVSYKGAGPFILTAGNFKEPFSFEQLMSNNNTLFTERSLLDTFAPARDFGFAAGTHGDRWTLVAGVFGGNINSGIAQDGISGTARATYAPIMSQNQLLHVGVAGSFRALDRAASDLSFSTTPEAFLFATSLVDTGPLRNATDVGRAGLEAAYQLGSARVQAEYTLTTVAYAAASQSRFQAGYVEAAWILNGGGRPYKLAPEYGSTYAVFGGVEVPDGLRVSRGGPGVFEVGARFSAIDLDSGAVRGGTQRDWSAGVNWYPDHNIKVMADYVRAEARPSSAALTGSDVTSNIFIGRVQLFW